MTLSVESARAAARLFDFRSFLLSTLQTNQDVAGLLDDVEDALSASPPVDVPADDQWVAWADPVAESAWIDSELATDWSAAAERLGWRA